MSLDARRQRSFRTDLLFIPLNKDVMADTRSKQSILYIIMKKIWTVVVLHPLVRPLWVRRGHWTERGSSDALLLSPAAVLVRNIVLHLLVPHSSYSSWSGPETGPASGTGPSPSPTSHPHLLLSSSQDSFLQNWFGDMNNYLHIGPPVYFVVKKGFNLNSEKSQNLICSGSGCDKSSLGTQLSLAAQDSN